MAKHDTLEKHNTPEQDSARGDDGEQGPKAIRGHSLTAAAVCVGTGATIALIAIFGHLG